MKYLSQTIKWALFLGGSALGGVAYQGFKACPTDDFSYVFAHHATASDFYQLMSEERVARIFADKMGNFPVSQSRKLARHLLSLSKQYRFDPAFILSLIHAESSFRKDVVSSAGAVGLMQLMPATAEVVSRRMDLVYTGERSLKDPFTNLTLGVAYLYMLREKYRNAHPYYHIAAYNLGPTRLDQLTKKKTFKPVSTKIYYEKIRRNVPAMRFYQGKETKGQKRV